MDPMWDAIFMGFIWVIQCSHPISLALAKRVISLVACGGSIPGIKPIYTGPTLGDTNQRQKHRRNPSAAKFKQFLEDPTTPKSLSHGAKSEK